MRIVRAVAPGRELNRATLLEVLAAMERQAPVQRWFLYLPFEHSEDIADQRTSVALFERLRDDPDSSAAIDYARQHLAIIERFGRFPHRNRALGRASSPEEEAFLRTPGSSF